MTEERILVVQLRQLGDILLTTPCLRVLRRERPKARITFLSHAMGRMVLDHCPFVDEHFFYDSNWNWRQHVRLARTLRERRFAYVFDFMNNPRSALYTLATGATERLAFESRRRLAYTRTVPRPGVSDYIVRERFGLLQGAGLVVNDKRDEVLVLPWFEAHTQPLMRLFGEDRHWRQAPVRVVISPTHRRLVRRWPLERYAAIADRLVREWQAAVLWLWGPGEEADIDQVQSLCKERTSKAPRTSFREMAALVANMDLFIGNSNGPSHVAVATEICSLQLHGHTSAVSWSPLTEQHQAMQSPEYGSLAVPTMQAISSEAVWDKLLAMRPAIESFAAQARIRGLRISWRDH